MPDFTFKRSRLGSQPFGYHDGPEVDISDLEEQRLEYSRLDYKAQQAAQRGLISWEDYTASKSEKHANFFQKYLMAGLGTSDKDTTGGTLETIGDVLSLGSYLTASLEQAGEAGLKHGEGLVVDPLSAGLGVRAGLDLLTQGKFSRSLPTSFRVGFSPSAFAQAWTNRTTWTKIADEEDLFGSGRANLIGGLAADVLLDPTTYLTFGVRKGLSVGLTESSRSLLPSLAAGAREARLSRWGTTMYKQAARILEPTLREELLRRGEVVGRSLLDGPLAKEYSDRIANYAVEHYDEVRAAYLRSATTGWWNKTKMLVAPGSEAARARVIQVMGSKAKAIGGLGVEDMFADTASFLGRERLAYDVTKVQTRLAGLNIGFGKVFDVLDKGWDAPPEVLEHLRLHQIAQETAFEAFQRSNREVFRGLDALDKETVSRAVEERALHADFGEATLGAVGTYPEPVERAIAHFQTEMGKILSEERGRGFQTGDVQGYVSHIPNAMVREYYLNILKKNGEQSLSTASRFTHQRMIASISEGEEIFGKGAFLTDAERILNARKRASLRMIAEKDLFDKIVAHHGVPTAIVHALRKGMSKTILRGFARRSGEGSWEVLHVDQVYKATNGNLAKLGFVDPSDVEDADAALAHNTEVLKYLHLTNDAAGKFSPEGAAKAAELNLPEEARLHFVEYGSELERTARPVPRAFRWTPRQVEDFDVRQGIVQGGRVPSKKEALYFDADKAMEMLADPEHPGWTEVLRKPEHLYGWLAGLNNYTKRWLDAQLPGMVPDVEERVLAAVKKAGLENEVKVGKVLSRFAEPLSVRKVIPQIPDTLVSLARASRRAAGVMTDSLPPTDRSLREVEGVLADLGFTPTVRKQLYRELFDREEIQYARDADLVLDTLRPFAEGTVPARLGSDVRRVTIKLNRVAEGNLLPELNDLTPGAPAAGGALRRGSTAQTYIKQSETLAAQEGLPPEAEQLIADTPTSDLSTRVPGREPPHPQLLGSRLDVAKRNADSAIAALRRAEAKHDAALGPLTKVQFRDLRYRVQATKAAVAVVRRQIKQAPKEEKAALKPLLQQALDKYKAASAELRPHKGRISKADVVYKEVEAARANLKEKAARLKEVLMEQRRLHASIAKESTGGGLRETNFVPNRTTSDRLLELRKLRNEALQPGSRLSVESIDRELSQLRSKLVAGELGGEAAGGTVVSHEPVELELYLPNSIAKLVEDLHAPGIDPNMSAAGKRALQIFDAIQGYWKVNVLLPFGAYWARNLAQNATLNVLRHGLGFLVDDNRRTGAAHALAYALATHSNYFKGVGQGEGKIARAIEAWGEHEIVSPSTGRRIKVKELNDEMVLRGIYRGMQTAEVPLQGLGNSLWEQALQHLGGTATGAAAGLAAGATLGATLAGEQGLNYGSALGTVLGGILGNPSSARLAGKALRKTGLEEKGLPFRMVDGGLGLVQSNFRPFVRVGEAAADLPFRINHYVQTFIDTGSASEAAHEVYTHMADYHGLSVVERRWLRRMIPFYVWTKTAFKSTGYQMVENPDRLGALFKGFRDWNEAHDADPEDVPDYLLGKLSMVIGTTKTKEAYRALVPQITTVEDTAGVLAGLNILPAFGANSDLKMEMNEFVKQLGGRASFAPALVAQVALQKDFFTGRNLDEATSAHQWETAPVWLQQLVSYTPEEKNVQGHVVKAATVHPTLTWLLGNIPQGRFISLARQVQALDEDGRRSLDTWALAKNFLAVSTVKVDPVTQRYFVNKGKIQKLKNLLDNIILSELPSAPSAVPRKRYLRR